MKRIIAIITSLMFTILVLAGCNSESNIFKAQLSPKAGSETQTSSDTGLYLAPEKICEKRNWK